MTMHVFAKLCYYALFPCWALAVFPPIKPVNIMANGLPDATKELRFDQVLDHFKFTDTRTWGQRYTINYNHYKIGAPILFIVGGQENITATTTMASGAIVDYAQQTNALILCLEHRYFGRSFPTKDLSTENLEYLNSEQALADLASFITDMPKLYPKGIPSTAKWIAFGESRGATLAARLRLKHPHLVMAAVSSSGPLLEKTNFNEYFVFMDEQLNTMKPGITDRIKEAYKMINTVVEGPDIELIEEKFKLCNSLGNNGQTKENVNFLYWTLTNLLSTVVQYGNHKIFKQTQQFVIDEMTNNSESEALDRFANVIHKIRKFFQRNCLTSEYRTIVNAFKDPSVDGDIYINNLLIAGTGSRQALYQNCTEYGQFETSDNYNIQLSFYDKLCIDVFGDQYGLKSLNSAVNRSVAFYGGLDIDVNHAIFVNGSLDAWSKLSITETKTNDRVSVFIEGASHCDAMNSTDDNPVLAMAQTFILKLLEKWLVENCENNLLSIRVE